MPVTGRGYALDPPIGHTGGFAEPTCHRCHSGAPLDPAGGRLTVDGVPAHYEAEAVYLLTVTLAHPAMKRAGFQLTARFVGGEHHGKQAGTFRGRDGRVQIDRAPSGVQYARHSPGGVIVEAIGSRARWHLEWRAPRRPSGVVVIHAAANAANHDDSELGDTVYTHEVQIAAGPR